MHESFVIETLVGELKITIEDSLLSRIDLNSELPLKPPASAIGKKILFELKAYFESPDHRFNIPILPSGTPYQQKVWRALTEIPAGKVMSYGELSVKLNSSARAIGNACRRNPTPIIVPCHRIIAKSGIGGFAGKTSGTLTDIKTSLLLHEGIKLTPDNKGIAMQMEVDFG